MDGASRACAGIHEDMASVDETAGGPPRAAHEPLGVSECGNIVLHLRIVARRRWFVRLAVGRLVAGM